MWHIAHVIVAVRYEDGTQDEYPVWENMYLIDAEDDREAQQKTLRRVQEFNEGSRSISCNDRPAMLEFVGIRKIIKCEAYDVFPTDGLEVSYSEYTVASEEEVRKLASGDAVRVTYEGD